MPKKESQESRIRPMARPGGGLGAGSGDCDCGDCSCINTGNTSSNVKVGDVTSIYRLAHPVVTRT
jgi:hypothetical protein